MGRDYSVITILQMLGEFLDLFLKRIYSITVVVHSLHPIIDLFAK